MLTREESKATQDTAKESTNRPTKTIEVHTASSDIGLSFNGPLADYAVLKCPLSPLKNTALRGQESEVGNQAGCERASPREQHSQTKDQQLISEFGAARADNPAAILTLRDLKSSRVLPEAELSIRRKEVAAYEELGETLAMVKAHVEDPRFSRVRLSDFKVQRVDLGDEIAVVLRGKIHSKGPQVYFIPKEYNIGDVTGLSGAVATVSTSTDSRSGNLSKYIIISGVDQVNKQWNHSWLQSYDSSTESKAKKWAAIYHHEEIHALGAVRGQRHASEYGAYRSQQSYEVSVGLRAPDNQRSDDELTRFALRSSTAPGSDIWLFLERNNGILGEDGMRHLERRGYSEDNVKQAVARWLELQQGKTPSSKDIETAYRRALSSTGEGGS